MGKGKKHLKKGGVGDTPSVSLLTVTQYERRDFLPILTQLIKEQDYSSIIEWVIVDGSKKDEDQGKLEKVIQDNSLQDIIPTITIRYVSTNMLTEAKRCIGRLRNIGNDNVCGDIIVCLDDDDYYPPCRVSHVVKKFKKFPKRKIAGNSPNLVYDYETNKMYQFRFFGQNHSVNTCLAYRKEYLTNHRYDDTAVKAEESSFTHKFKEPMIQLDPDKTVYQMSYTSNTVNKRKVILDCLLRGGEGGSVKLLKGKTLENDFFTNPTIITQFKECFERRTIYKCPYDIVFYCGQSIPWDPRDKGLGGSEQSVYHIATHMAQQFGKRVCVYADLKEGQTEFEYDGVLYKSHFQFRLSTHYNTLILWRSLGMVPWCTDLFASDRFPLHAKQLYVDMHDNSLSAYQMIRRHIDKIDGVFYKSQFHWLMSKKMNAETPVWKSHMIPNGIRVRDFEPPTETRIERNPYRLCYASCYTRGLEPILEKAWPIIKKNEPRAELHIYYGMEHVKDESFKSRMKSLLQQEGVFEYGRQPLDVIAEEKWKSGFHLYYTESLLEIDCISIRESLVAGCIPILSKTNLFQFRDGIHVKVQPHEEGGYECLANSVLELFQRPDQCEQIRHSLRQSHTIMDWQTTTRQWMDVISVDSNRRTDLETYTLPDEYHIDDTLTKQFSNIYFLAEKSRMYPYQILFSDSIMTVITDTEEENEIELWKQIIEDETIQENSWSMIIRNTAFSTNTFYKQIDDLCHAIDTHGSSLGLVFLGGGSYVKGFTLPSLYEPLLCRQSKFVYQRKPSMIKQVGPMMLHRHCNAYACSKQTLRTMLSFYEPKPTPSLTEQINSWCKEDKIPCSEVFPHPFFSIQHH